MKRVTPIWTAAALTGVLLVAGLAARGAQDNQTRPPGQPEIGKQSEVPRGTVTDEQRADILMAQKFYSKAIDSYSILIKTYSDSPQKKDEVSGLWNKVGICYQQELDYGKARKAYKEAIKLNREFAPAWNNLGTSFYLERKPKKSIKYYRHAIKLSPDSARVPRWKHVLPTRGSISTWPRFMRHWEIRMKRSITFVEPWKKGSTNAKRYLMTRIS
jgi:tetratricopeptide (TPR) repeat protein